MRQIKVMSLVVVAALLLSTVLYASEFSQSGKAAGCAPHIGASSTVSARSDGVPVNEIDVDLDQASHHSTRSHESAYAPHAADDGWLDTSSADPYLVWHMQQKLLTWQLQAQGKNQDEIDAQVNQRLGPPPVWKNLPTKGTVKIPVICIEFPDYPHESAFSVDYIKSRWFGTGDPTQYPEDSVHNWYERSSNGQLDITGDVYGWWMAPHPRSYYTTWGGLQALIEGAVTYYHNQGVDFSQYDNNHDGKVECVYFHWSGPGDYTTLWSDFVGGWPQNFNINGVLFSKFGWGGHPGGGAYYISGDLHELGHLLGLPDLYKYNDNAPGPLGGVGQTDRMDKGPHTDFSCFSKFFLDWITPTVISSGQQVIELRPSGALSPGKHPAVLIMPGASLNNPFSEFFMVQYRQIGVGNDDVAKFYLPGKATIGDGLAIWHVDATLNAAHSNFAYNNQDTPHKLLRLMEADGLEEIEKSPLHMADAGDYYTPGKTFTPSTFPNSNNYAGQNTGVIVVPLKLTEAGMTVRFEFREEMGEGAVGNQSPKPSLTATAPPTTVTTGQTFDVNGALTDATSGAPLSDQTIQLQKNVSGMWASVTNATATTSGANGIYTVLQRRID